MTALNINGKRSRDDDDEDISQLPEQKVSSLPIMADDPLLISE